MVRLKLILPKIEKWLKSLSLIELMLDGLIGPARSSKK